MEKGVTYFCCLWLCHDGQSVSFQRCCNCLQIRKEDCYVEPTYRRQVFRALPCNIYAMEYNAMPDIAKLRMKTLILGKDMESMHPQKIFVYQYALIYRLGSAYLK